MKKLIPLALFLLSFCCGWAHGQQAVLVGSNVNGVFTPWTSSLTSGQVPTPPSFLAKCKNGNLVVDCPLPSGGSSYNPAAVAITGGTINNTIIGGTTPAAITGTTITATTQFLVPNGSAGYADSDFPASNFSFLSNFPATRYNSLYVTAWEDVLDIVGSAYCHTWASGLITNSLADTGLCRDAAGAIDVGNGTAGSKSGTINATNATFTGLLTAPTAAVATNTTQVATTAFALANTVGATLSVGTAAWGAGALNAAITSTVASHAGHFTNIQVLTALGGTCTTPPQFNVFAGTTNIGTPVTATITTQTKGNSTNTAQTLAFAAGDTIGIYISTAGVVCTVPVFSITAQYSTP